MTGDVGRSYRGDARGWDGNRTGRTNPTVLFFEVRGVLFVVLWSMGSRPGETRSGAARRPKYTCARGKAFSALPAGKATAASLSRSGSRTQGR